MEHSRQREMHENYAALPEDELSLCQLYVFGHTDATDYLINMVQESGHEIAGILDNNKAKQGSVFAGVPIIAPQELCQKSTDRVMVFITSRAYAAMLLQLKELGFQGRVVKLVDYNTFAEYGLSPDIIDRRLQCEQRGREIISRLQEKSGDNFIIICPFKAVGDVYYAMKYLREFCQKWEIREIAAAVVGDSCAAVARLFCNVPMLVMEQGEMDVLVQAVLFHQPSNVLIVHHDRPYSNYLIRLLRICPISFERFYKIGIYGLSDESLGDSPVFWQGGTWAEIPKGRSVVLMPYAKSVVNLPVEKWENIARVLKDRGYTVFSSVQGEEFSIADTEVLRNIPLSAMKSMVEWAGCFISIRNGLCDILQGAECRKILLYPEACYSDTPWQVAQFFSLQGCDNVVFKNDGSWMLYDAGGNRPFDFTEDLDF